MLAVLGLAFAPASQAELKIFATVPEWGALAQEIGGDQVSVYTATNALQDPHRVEAKPSLIARARAADLVVATGAELEVGWLPVVLREAGNARVQPGEKGYFEAAPLVRLLEIPTRLDRADGDVHAGGNPHIQTDPRNILKVGEALAVRMAQLDAANAATYQARFRAFGDKWRSAMSRWESQAMPLKGLSVLVQHQAYPYLEDWLGLKQVATLEPKPGIEPTVAHLSSILQQLKAQPAKMVIRSAYQQDAPSQWIAERARIPVVVLPFTVGGTAEAKDLFGLFDDTVRRLLQAATP
jgi:zinc/manganese transport system substrate-binding protein